MNADDTREVADGKGVFVGFSEAPEVNTFVLRELQLDPLEDPQNIRNFDQGTFVRWMARRIDDGWIPTLEEAKAIVCKSTEIVHQWWDSDRQTKLPWPNQYVRATKSISDGIHVDYLMPIAQSSTLGEIKEDEDSGKHALVLVSELTKRLSDSEKSAFGVYVLQSFKEFTSHGEDMGWTMLAIVGDTVGPNVSLENFGPTLSTFYKNWVDERFNKGWRPNERPMLMPDVLVTAMESHNLLTVLFRQELTYNATNQFDRLKRFTQILQHYASGPFGSEQQSKLAIKRFPSFLNDLRRGLSSSDVPIKERMAIEDTLRGLMGLSDEAPVHDALEHLYSAIKFEEYPVSKTIENTRVTFIRDLLYRQGIRQHSHILELGSGTGWLLGGLRSKHLFMNMKGIDGSERNVAVAKKTYGTSLFEVANWYDIPDVPKYKQMDAIISDGRSLSHVEDEEHLKKVIEEVRDHLRDDGILIFDKPFPRTGSYATGVELLRNVMKTIGLPEDEVNNAWYIVDSPDGQNYYNRLVLPPEKVVKMVEDLGFELVLIVTEPIPNGHGDVDVTFTFRKIRTPDEKHLKYEETKKRWKETKDRAEKVHQAFASEIVPREFKP